MSFFISTQAEMLKTKRTAAFWLTIIAAAFIPLMFFIALFAGDTDSAEAAMTQDPWTGYFKFSWQIFCVFLIPAYTILICSLITQIEYRNNTWKQVFASPQSLGNIFFSKFVAIQLMILFCMLLFNAFLIFGAVIANLMNSKFMFIHRGIDWPTLMRLNGKVYLAVLGVSAFQYWLSLRFKNFIASLGIGLALMVVGMVALINHSHYVYKWPYCYPTLSYDFLQMKGRPFLENHEWNSLGYFVFFLLIGFFDMKLRKEKG